MIGRIFCVCFFFSFFFLSFSLSSSFQFLCGIWLPSAYVKTAGPHLDIGFGRKYFVMQRGKDMRNLRLLRSIHFLSLSLFLLPVSVAFIFWCVYYVVFFCVWLLGAVVTGCSMYDRLKSGLRNGMECLAPLETHNRHTERLIKKKKKTLKFELNRIKQQKIPLHLSCFYISFRIVCLK